MRLVEISERNHSNVKHNKIKTQHNTSQRVPFANDQARPTLHNKECDGEETFCGVAGLQGTSEGPIETLGNRVCVLCCMRTISPSLHEACHRGEERAPHAKTAAFHALKRGIPFSQWCEMEADSSCLTDTLRPKVVIT